ncbi:MAG: PA14 domain-containing protein [Kiritimatiellia bacterium]
MAGGAGSFSNNLPFPNGTGAADDDFAVEATGLLEIPVDGDYQFGFRSDDGASLRITGQTWSNLTFAVNANSVISGDTLIHNALTGDSHTRASIRLAAGTYPVRVVYFERGGGAHLEVYGDSLLNIQPDLLRGGGFVATDPPGLALAVVEPVQIAAPSVHPVSGDLTLSWNSMPGTSYRVEWSVDYTTGIRSLSGVASPGRHHLPHLRKHLRLPVSSIPHSEEN